MPDQGNIPTLGLVLMSVLLAIVPLTQAVVGGGGGPDLGPVLSQDEPILKPDSEFEKTEWGYVKKSFDFPADGSGVPVILEKEGYSGAGTPDAYLEMSDGTLIALEFDFDVGPDQDYAWVEASIRGTECSGGQFNLYDRTHAWDSYQIIEWLGEQPWSNGNVGMIGWSFSGQTAFWAATTQPSHLKAVAPSLLHADIYRDIFMPGGVENYAFPVIWYLTSPHRVPEHAIDHGDIPNDEICTQNQADETDPNEPPILMRKAIWAAIEETDNDWYAQHAAANWADEIDVPYLQQTNWHDEQTGPRSVVLWDYVDPGPATYTDCASGEEVTVDSAKWIRMGNGDHGHGSYVSDILWDWFDIWLKGDCDDRGILEHQVVNYFEADSHAPNTGDFTATKSSDQWPHPDTDWIRLYTRGDGSLVDTAPTGDTGTQTYLSGTPVQNNWFFPSPGDGEEVREDSTLPTKAQYATEPLAETTVLNGPILFDMYASLAGTDTDFFVTISDVFPDGQVEYVQRGLLKASHNAVDERRSWYNDAGEMIQPYRPHTNPNPQVPGEVVHYPIEIWPTGHIFREDHRILVEVHTPPVIDGLWGYTATEHDPAAVTIHSSADHPTSILLPQVAVDGGNANIAADPDGCGTEDGFPCAGPSYLDQATGS